MKVIKGKDVLGNDIKVGDYIVYGAAKGRCAGLNIGRIAAIGKGKGAWNKGQTTYTAEAIQVEWDRYERTGLSSYSSNKKPRPVTLQFSERICVVPESTVPEALREMLK